MILFLPEDIWKTKRGFYFGKSASYLKIGYHAGQDFYSNPVGKIPVVAPCAGFLTTFPFSKSAGWWGYYKFKYSGETYSLKLLHMYRQMKDGEYNEGDIMGYCGATGLSMTSKYGISYIGEMHEEQTSDRAVPHLHAELHKGEYQHDTNRVKELADKRTIDPVSIFEGWIKEESDKNKAQESIAKEKESSTEQVGVSDFQESRETKQKEERPQDSSNVKGRSAWEMIMDAVKEWLSHRK